MRYIILVLLGFIAAGNTAGAAESVGFKQISLPDQKGGRALNVTLLYPAQQSGKGEVMRMLASRVVVRWIVILRVRSLDLMILPAGHDVPCRREDDDLPDESI